MSYVVLTGKQKIFLELRAALTNTYFKYIFVTKKATKKAAIVVEIFLSKSQYNT